MVVVVDINFTVDFIIVRLAKNTNALRTHGIILQEKKVDKHYESCGVQNTM